VRCNRLTAKTKHHALDSAAQSRGRAAQKLPGKVSVSPLVVSVTVTSVNSGELLAFDDAGDDPWVLISCVDGRWWDVQAPETKSSTRSDRVSMM
jgi:hypothetical protein